MAAQAPHCPRPQPNLGPFNSRSFRNTYSSGVSGAASTTCGSPLTAIRYDILHLSMNVNDLTHVSFAGRTRDCAMDPASVTGSYGTTCSDVLDKIGVTCRRRREVEAVQRAAAAFATATRPLERRLSRLIAPAPKAAI